MVRITRFTLFMLLCCLFASHALHAQRLDGTLRITVTDKTGSSIEDARVTVTNQATNVPKTATAYSAGTYVFPDLTVRTYSVNVLPFNTLGGDVKEFAVFAPGTTTQQGGVQGSGGSIGGLRPRFNGFSIDGVDDNRLDVNGPTQPVIQESVAEFTLLTNQFGAEYGHSAGGQFNIVTKPGTNDWHGTAWWYDRNRDLDAATNQEKTSFTGTGDVKNRFDYNREGGSIGGPIKRNRLFIYGAYEFQGEGLGSQGATVTMPTASGMQQLQALNPDTAVLAVLKDFPTAPTKSGTTIVNGTHIDIGQFAGVAPNFSNESDFTINAALNLGSHH